MNTVRIMTYNIQGCRGSDGQVNPDRVLSVIADSAPDVIALQDTGSPALGDVLPYLAERLGMTLHRDPSGSEVAFLSDFPLKGVQLTDLGNCGYCLRADLDSGGKRMHLLNVALNPLPRFRCQQVSRLLGPELLGHPSMVCPVLVIGDFSDCLWGSGNLGLAAALRRGRRPLWRGTYPAQFPLFGRDRGYTRGALRILDGKIDYSRLARQAAGHLPLTLTVQITDSRPSLHLRQVPRGRMEAAPG
ncbi:MAG: hypothetical protein C0614_02605 [Desulfuromonas sp.]|nr:MAG: hypothetical protein C0614_02605 [Desulfuromonas sp.]